MIRRRCNMLLDHFLRTSLHELVLCYVKREQLATMNVGPVTLILISQIARESQSSLNGRSG
jgi:hypothetical protein